MKILMFLVFFAGIVHADQLATVWSRHPSAVQKYFPKQKYKMLDAHAEEKDLEESGYIPSAKRDAIFQKLHLEEKVRRMDEMNKDILVMDARFDTLDKMEKRYPHFTTVELQSLRDEVRNAR